MERMSSRKGQIGPAHDVREFTLSVYAGNVCTALPRVGESGDGYTLPRWGSGIAKGLDEVNDLVSQARAAIAASANLAAVKQRLQQNGIDPPGL
jgi:hypothetical protein